MNLEPQRDSYRGDDGATISRLVRPKQVSAVLAMLEWVDLLAGFEPCR